MTHPHRAPEFRPQCAPDDSLICKSSGAAQSAPSTAFDPAAGPTIHIEDVARFYKVYDAASGHPTADQLQHDYIDPGSDGLHQFARVRNISGTRIAEALGRHPPVTIAVGRGKPVGVGSPVTGVQIGLEALCGTDYLNPNVEDRFVHVIAHEFAHVQQVPALVDNEHPTVLELSLVEGAAELTAELISGEVAYSHFRASTEGREKEIETAFVSDVDKTDLSQWLNNGTPEKPGDLGYWVGYRVVKSYYEHASDKRRAFREILEM